MTVPTLRVTPEHEFEAVAPARPSVLPPLRLPQTAPGELLLLEALRMDGSVPAPVLAEAHAQHLRLGTPLRDTLLLSGAIDEPTLIGLMAAAYRAGQMEGPFTADPRLVNRLGLAACLALNIAPVTRSGGTTVVATSRPQNISHNLRRLAPLGPVRMVLAPEAEVERALLAPCRPRLTDAAESRVPAAESCRDWPEGRIALAGLAAALLALVATVLWPVIVLAVLTGFAILALSSWTVLRAFATLAALRRNSEGGPFQSHRHRPATLPRVSVLVPLFREREIAGRLLRRLSKLTYPKDRLEVCLIIEEDDTVTRAALTQAPLPHWFRLVEVPRGRIKTKPRALNYALTFCKGEIIGIYDAEDAPEPDQIERVIDHFANAAPEVACLQGVLDFYNANENWLARCFAIEYASLFRVVLPGLERLGLVIPLGGTTLFMRRDALEKLGCWDAHNVTEDADLGVRLARHGYRTETIQTVTGEEANCHLWPWIRQRSRWLKGYAMTWACHMRRPGFLWCQLGAWRFLGVQVMFLGTVSQYLLAPVLWSFWLLLFGLSHPLEPLIGRGGLIALAAVFAVSAAINIAVGVVGAAATRHRGLVWWVPTMHFYFPLATLGAWKGLIEIATRPYYWDKTMHGFSAATPEDHDPAPAPTEPRGQPAPA